MVSKLLRPFSHTPQSSFRFVIDLGPGTELPIRFHACHIHLMTFYADIFASRILDSIKANRRLQESRYSPLKLAPKSQNSVFGMMRATAPKQEQG